MHNGVHEAPLTGLNIVEFTGLGPGPFAGMMLADMGANIIRIDRKASASDFNELPEFDFMARGRRSIALDLKTKAGVEVALKLIACADGLIEGFLPGVMERLGLGPDVCRALNQRLVYGRMTGWGQSGPLSQTAGHDLNYIALTGALWASGEDDRKPAFALNLLGDFGGGGMLLAYGMLAGIIKANRTGYGDVVDASICDGTSLLMTMIHSQRAMGKWADERNANLLDGGVPWYAVYQCSDGHWITVAALEPKFWSCLLEKLGKHESDFGDRANPENWPVIEHFFTERFKSEPRAHWVSLLEGTDACFAPVLSPAEAPAHSHTQAREGFAPTGPDQPMPAPRFSDSATPLTTEPALPGQHSREILKSIGLKTDTINQLIADGVVNCTNSTADTD